MFEQFKHDFNCVYPFWWHNLHSRRFLISSLWETDGFNWRHVLFFLMSRDSIGLLTGFRPQRSRSKSQHDVIGAYILCSRRRLFQTILVIIRFERIQQRKSELYAPIRTVTNTVYYRFNRVMRKQQHSKI
jgi:hypothetical protein